MPSYKLMYFNARGAGEVSRLLFKVAGVEFEDVRYSNEEWPTKKPGMPLQAMPVLEIDGKKFCQSNAIARYLAKTFGLMGSNALEEFKIDELQEAIAEIFNKHLIPIYIEKDEAKKKEMAEKVVKDTLPLFLNFIELRLKENKDGKGFFVGDKISLGDILIYNTMFMVKAWFGAMGVSVFEDRPLLLSHFERVGSYPKIAEWVKVRPESAF